MLAELKPQDGLDDFYYNFHNEGNNPNYLYNIYYKVFHPLTPAIPVTTTMLPTSGTIKSSNKSRFIRQVSTNSYR